MRKKQIILTPEQEKYRKEILGKKYKVKKDRQKNEKPKVENFPPFSYWTKWQLKAWLLGNCNFWFNNSLNEDGTLRDCKRMKETIQALEEHCKELRKMLNSDKNVQGSVATGDDSSTNAGNKAPKSTTNK